MKRFAILLAAAMLAAGCGRPVSSYSWEEDLAYRESVDFTWSRERVKTYIQKYIPDVTDAQIDEWTENGPLEAKVIDGELKYFNRTAAGLFRVDPECRAIKQAHDLKNVEPERLLNGKIIDDDEQALIAQIRDIMDDVLSTGEPIQPGDRMKVKYTITVDADAVPAGEKIRCWLPYPRSDVARQTDVKFIGASEKKYKFSKPDCPHSTLYMEKKAVAGEPTVFSEEFEYTYCPEWHRIDPDKILPYDKSTALYKENTAEREAHIIFTDRLKALADELTEGIDNPYLQAKAIFTWIRANYPWAGAREYSTLEMIPEYVLDAGHGDCGQVTLLLMTLLRIKGIPCHWQSGFVMDPSGWNLHDWCEVYYEGYGWIPTDQSAGVKDWGWDEDSRYYYLSGFGRYRMIVNQDYGRALSPKKIYPRSETVDFQRGEVEWRGGNIYFDSWDYDMDIEYLR